MAYHRDNVAARADPFDPAKSDEAREKAAMLGSENLLRAILRYRVKYHGWQAS